MNLQSNDFEIFGLEPRFAQDKSEIDTRWKELQREVHPDRFAMHGTASQRVAMQWSVRINEAYQRLKNPLRRAAYLCEMHGVEIQAENNTTMPSDFLIQQMEWRENLDEAKNEEAVNRLGDEVHKEQNDTIEHCGYLIDEHQDYVAAAADVRKMMFIERFALDIERKLDLI
ncbi:Fe-S protein assembly co-chaperone HscB [Acidovorax sp. GBBC 3334]|uniref:Fe-S protein assembly co-chaperone HscB n=1 Tax=Acidovorax sp. GBBC 3334 TaxID=2940496 RepID=UPI002302FB33|nr:Fe-S protein assembly co-chaperone HscB [Acidovorax sp. GBBC 3334]MDA8453456.1 Fe-S protein assembly co-chaperone HscB [Acidovorax sp. GBBC 3334]